MKIAIKLLALAAAIAAQASPLQALEIFIGPGIVDVPDGEAIRIVDAARENASHQTATGVTIGGGGQTVPESIRVGVWPGQVYLGPISLTLTADDKITYRRFPAPEDLEYFYIESAHDNFNTLTILVEAGEKLLIFWDDKNGPDEGYLVSQSGMFITWMGRSWIIPIKDMRGIQEIPGPTSVGFSAAMHAPGLPEGGTIITNIYFAYAIVDNVATLSPLGQVEIDPGEATVALQGSTNLTDWQTLAYVPLSLTNLSYFRLEIAD